MEIKVIVPDELMQLIASEIAQRANLATQTTNNERRLNIGEAAEYCGVSRATFGRWRKKFKLPGRSVGGVIRYQTSELDKFLKTKKM